MIRRFQNSLTNTSKSIISSSTILILLNKTSFVFEKGNSETEIKVYFCKIDWQSNNLCFTANFMKSETVVLETTKRYTA